MRTVYSFVHHYHVITDYLPFSLAINRHPCDFSEDRGVPWENSLPRTWVDWLVVWYPFLHSPSQKRVRVFALFLHGKVWVWSWTTFHPEICNQAGIGITHYKLTEHINAVVCYESSVKRTSMFGENEAYLCAHAVHAVGCRKLPHLASPYYRCLLAHLLQGTCILVE